MALALRELEGRDDCRVAAVSRLYKTPPWGKIDQSFFFNACAAVDTRLTPEALLDLCLDIERRMKRERIERWGPRTLDIDILTFGNVVQEAPRLEIPHPRMIERAFVLMPLADIAPHLEVSGKTIAGWLEAIDTTGIEVADGDTKWWQRY
ncbi:2-amino-4-hydroxy-6-hydroxymethyldihydropteridine diphosphokinase [Rhizobium sp. BK251]|nr:2-amino-4-hydroxy-6-hydroxymethyldihydropteridine diphosphokinase [Rhizobium sp. BK251]